VFVVLDSCDFNDLRAENGDWSTITLCLGMK